jgi:hypothetical protein
VHNVSQLTETNSNSASATVICGVANPEAERIRQIGVKAVETMRKAPAIPAPAV